MMRRRLGLAALALVTLGASMTASPSSAGAATLLKSSWWYRAHTGDTGSFLPPATPAIPGGAPTVPATAPTPAPPTVAAGSVLVEGTPDGADAVAALAWTLVQGETAPVLTVKPSSTSNVPADAVILACRSAVTWAEPDSEPGAWEDKPLVDCGISVQGIPNPDGSIGFGLAPLVSGDTLDVVLAPGLAQEQPARVGSTFSLSFDPTKDATLKTDVADAPFSANDSFSSPSYPAPSYSAPSASFVVPSAPVPAAQPALEPQEQMAVVPQQTALPPTRPVKDDNTAQGVGFLILLAGLAFGGLAYVTPARDEDGTVGLGRFRRARPELVAPPLEPVSGGLGRFRRPRTGPPPALS